MNAAQRKAETTFHGSVYYAPHIPNGKSPLMEEFYATCCKYTATERDDLYREAAKIAREAKVPVLLAEIPYSSFASQGHASRFPFLHIEDLVLGAEITEFSVDDLLKQYARAWHEEATQQATTGFDAQKKTYDLRHELFQAVVLRIVRERSEKKKGDSFSDSQETFVYGIPTTPSP